MEKSRPPFKYQGELVKIKEYVLSYQYSLRALVLSLPKEIARVISRKFIPLGANIIWPCIDGVIVLTYKDPLNAISVKVRSPQDKSVNEFIISSRAMALYDAKGNRHPKTVGIQITQKPIDMLYFFSLTSDENGVRYSCRYDMAMAVGWEANLPEPDEQALSNFQTAFVIRNIGGTKSEEAAPKDRNWITVENAAKLVQEFNALLDNADKEAELQDFLNNQPKLIFPEYIECFPKFELGSEYETDFVFSNQGQQGREYVFVEIERANKKIFTQGGQFTADFSQAKKQILDWDRWVKNNHDYISRKLKGLFEPKFYLIMGRGQDLTDEQRQQITLEFANKDYIFSTYDDLVDRFKQIISGLGTNG